MKTYTVQDISRAIGQRGQIDSDDKYVWVKWNELSDDDKKIVNVERVLNGWKVVHADCLYAAVYLK